MLWIELRTIGIIFIMLILPGWAFLAITQIWRRYNAIQRWFLAISISIAFYPIFFYLLRWGFPSLTIGYYKLSLLLLVFASVIVWKLRKEWKEQFNLGKWGGVILGVLGATLFTRLWLAHLYPYPAWTDSLHHTLLTNLVATNGYLPTTLLPYAPTSLDQYHLGLYALTGPLQMLAGIPAHTALLWMAQVLNGLCGIGVFLFLDKKVSRLAGLVGMVVVGLLNFQPAWYFNWGRFTQVSSQAILLPAALLTWEAIGLWRKEWPELKSKILIISFLAAALNAGVFLLHFRVAGYAIPLLAIIAIYEFLLAIKSKNRLLQTITGILLIVIISLLLISPVLFPALEKYVDKTVVENIELNSSNGKENNLDDAYFGGFNWETVWILGVKKWLVYLAAIGGVLGLWHKQRSFSILTIVWIGVLTLEGFAYLLGIPLLAFTNMTGMMIMLYLPIGLLVGILAHEIFNFYDVKIQNNIESILLWILLFIGFVASFYRTEGVERYRHFMTKQDQSAMEWIKGNTPEDAIFAIHTYYWLANSPHGSEAGYWIPYFAERQTTAGTMISGLGPGYESILQQSGAVMALYEADSASVAQLCELGVTYLYDGAKPAFDGKAFDLEGLTKLSGVELLYKDGDVSILRICR